jgi:hypothetical protein
VKRERLIDALHIDAGNIAFGKSQMGGGGRRVWLWKVALKQCVGLQRIGFINNAALAIEKLEFRLHRARFESHHEIEHVLALGGQRRAQS